MPNCTPSACPDALPCVRLVLCAQYLDWREPGEECRPNREWAECELGERIEPETAKERVL